MACNTTQMVYEKTFNFLPIIGKAEVIRNDFEQGDELRNALMKTYAQKKFGEMWDYSYKLNTTTLRTPRTMIVHNMQPAAPAVNQYNNVLSGVLLINDGYEGYCMQMACGFKVIHWIISTPELLDADKERKREAWLHEAGESMRSEFSRTTTGQIIQQRLVELNAAQNREAPSGVEQRTIFASTDRSSFNSALTLVLLNA